MTEPVAVVVTPTERRVVGELALDGATNAEIARRLHITEDTVKSHVRRVMQATRMPNRTALVCALLRGRLVLRTEDQRKRAA